jgi:hypothetical protein
MQAFVASPSEGDEAEKNGNAAPLFFATGL